MAVDTVLPQGAGYGVVVGIGFFFALFMLLLTYMQKRYTGFSPSESEEFNSASRSVKPGLIASGIVSAWTWAGTLLTSSSVCFRTGISGAYWYAAGATVQVLLFAMLSAKLKLNAPNAHTWVEIVRARWGMAGHHVFLGFAMVTNIIVSAMLILGGSATVADLTGMHVLAACFLIPIGVAVYVLFGGMRATLLCDYTHTTVLYAIIMAFCFTAYASGDKIGSPRALYDLLVKAGERSPVDGNAHGSYLTMHSVPGLVFGVINVIGNFGTVFLDQAYWQRAVASRPATAVKAYMLGGLAWFPIPFAFASVMGLTGAALQGIEGYGFPVLSAFEISSGLPAPTAAVALLGKAGAAVILVLLFLAVTSATSAELIATSSLCTYDIYKALINPHASEAEIMRVSHAMVVVYAIFMGFLGLIFHYIGISMGWLYEFMGCVLGAGVVPVALCLTWSKANKWGCIGGAVTGVACAITVWLVVTAKLNDGVINVANTGGDYPMLAGNVTSIVVSAVIAIITSLINPDNFDFDITRAINAEHAKIRLGHAPAPIETSDIQSTDESSDKKKDFVDAHAVPKLVAASILAAEDPELDPVQLQKDFNMAKWAAISVSLILLIIVPLPLFFSSYIYTPSGFTGWLSVGIAWLFCGSFIVVLYPLWESREGLVQILKGVICDIFTGGNGAFRAETESSSA